MVNNDANLITPYIAALICKAAYAKIPPATVENWQLIDKADLNDYGYAGIAYSHPTATLILVAHRGTEPNILSNLVTDTTLFFNRRPLAQQSAQAFSLRVRSAADDYQVIETGHSLGGFHAELNAAHFKSHCITFDSPGSQDHLLVQETINHDYFTTYLSIPNSINTAKGHLGKVYRVYVPHTETHTLTALSDAFKPLLQAIEQPLTSAKSIGLNMVKSQLDADLQSHALDTLLAQIDSNTGHPWLMREVIKWPRTIDFNLWRFNPLNYDVKAYSKETIRIYKQVVKQNHRYEAALNQIANYELGAFIIPSLADNDLHTKLYYQKALSQFDSFYEDIQLRNEIIAQFPQASAYAQPSLVANNSKLALWNDENTKMEEGEAVTRGFFCTIS